MPSFFSVLILSHGFQSSTFNHMDLSAVILSSQLCAGGTRPFCLSIAVSLPPLDSSSSHRGTDCHRVQTLLCRKDAAQTWLSAFSEPPAHRVQQDERGGPVAVSGTKPSCAMCPYPWTPFDMQLEIANHDEREGAGAFMVWVNTAW
jgi:hypothetical protein